MKIIETDINDLLKIENFTSFDERGSFTKTYHQDDFISNKLQLDFRECYFSVSIKNVVRGMHFQLPPYDHEKLIYVVNGEVLDVVLDLRKEAATYGRAYSCSLSAENHCSLYIPKGLAHGFLSIKDDTIMMYSVSSVYNKESDTGIRFDSFGFQWPVINPIISKRDRSLPSFAQFADCNPF